VQSYEPKYPKAAQCLAKDKDNLLTFYDFPAEHWHHIRTSNPIESTFASVRLRTAQNTRMRITSEHSVDGIQTHQERRAALAETAWT
jgi:transposase-like protein